MNNTPQNTRSTPNENYIIPISIIRLLLYTETQKKQKKGKKAIIGTWK
jgi:hypothetical protein